MSNRTDWEELVSEILEMFGLDLLAAESGQNWLPAVRERLETELHNAFVAGQESEKSPETISELLLDELKELRAFKEEWETKDGNSPGYNLQKARTYGKQGHIYKQLFEAYKGAAEALSMVSVIKEGAGTRTYLMARDLISQARKLEVDLMNEWTMPKWGKGPAEEMVKVQLIAKKHGVELKTWGKTPIEELTTEQLMEEVNRREGTGPYTDLHVSVVVTGKRPTGHRTVLMDWEHSDIDPDSYSTSYNDEFIRFEAKRKRSE